MKLFLILCLVGFSYGELPRKLKLSSGYEMPIIGFGTYGMKNLEELEKSVESALENGYRYFDMHFCKKNEPAIGKVLKKWFDQGGKREELFITSKLPEFGNRPSSVEKYLKRSLENLGLDYVDMYLVPQPFAAVEGDNYSSKKLDGKFILDSEIDHLALWKEMEKQVKAGRAKSIGLSNFNETQIKYIYDNAEIKPSNLQVESHAYLQQKKLREFCKEKKIVMTAYAPLGSMERKKTFYTEKNLPYETEIPLIKELALKYKKAPAQILLRHLIQDGLAIIPKSKDSKRQKENMMLFDFELTPEDFMKIGALDMGEKGRLFNSLDSYNDLKKSPQYPYQGFSN